MTDIFLKDFYNRVRDESWPVVNTYDDFLKLPSHIQTECLYDHKLNYRLAEMESPEYWRTQIIDVYRYKNLAYLPIGKCASTYYTNLFHEKLGWEKCKFLNLAPETVCFGLFNNPTERYLKGLTEWTWNNILPMVDYDISKIFSPMLKTILIGDAHSLPYYTTFGSILDKVNCIPMSGKSDNEIKKILTNLFKSQNHNIALPLNDEKMHKSSDSKLKLYNLIKENFEIYPIGDKNRCGSSEFRGRVEFMHILLSSDLKFYRNLIQTFDPDWQQIKTI
jgi:hypothetical protein